MYEDISDGKKPSELFIFKFCVWWAWLLTNQFTLSSVHILSCKFMCICEDPAFIACMSPLWQAGYSLLLIKFFISPWLELKWQIHFVIFSIHICVNRIH